MTWLYMPSEAIRAAERMVSSASPSALARKDSTSGSPSQSPDIVLWAMSNGKVIDSLLAKGLIEQAVAKRGEPAWRESGDGEGITFVATDAAFEALGIELDQAPDVGDTGGTGHEEASAGSMDAASKEPAPGAPTRVTRANSKQAQLIAMLQRPEGASIAEIADAFGWLPHTVRGVIAGALKKKLGLEVTSEKIESRGRVHRIIEA